MRVVAGGEAARHHPTTPFLPTAREEKGAGRWVGKKQEDDYTEF